MITIESVFIFPIILIIVFSFVLIINSEFVYAINTLNNNYILLKSGFEKNYSLDDSVNIDQSVLKRVVNIDKQVEIFDSKFFYLLDNLEIEKDYKNKLTVKNIRRNIILNKIIMDVLLDDN